MTPAGSGNDGVARWRPVDVRSQEAGTVTQDMVPRPVSEGMSGEDTVLFVCPDCGGRIPATRDVMETLRSAGCVFCGAPVTESAFVAP